MNKTTEVNKNPKTSEALANITKKIRAIDNHPRPGVIFRDITTLLQDSASLQLMINHLVEHYQDKAALFDFVVGIEARGFIIGGALAYLLGKGFIPIRKPGKLPAKVISAEYQLEYGIDKVEIHADALYPGSKVLVVDDLLATGGTALAAAKLIKKLNASIMEFAFIINLKNVGGEKKLIEQGYSLYYLTEFL